MPPWRWGCGAAGCSPGDPSHGPSLLVKGTAAPVPAACPAWAMGSSPVLCWAPLLQSLLGVPACPRALGSPCWGPALLARSHQCRAEGQPHCPRPAGCTPMPPGRWLSFLQGMSKAFSHSSFLLPTISLLMGQCRRGLSPPFQPAQPLQQPPVRSCLFCRGEELLCQGVSGSCQAVATAVDVLPKGKKWGSCAAVNCEASGAGAGVLQPSPSLAHRTRAAICKRPRQGRADCHDLWYLLPSRSCAVPPGQGSAANGSVKPLFFVSFGEQCVESSL